jgi:hypothetical protein
MVNNLIGVNIKGFYSKFEADETAQCDSTGTSVCILYPLVDRLDIFQVIAGGGNFDTTTHREAKHWGASLELDSLAPVMGTPFRPFFGLSMRGIDQKTELLLTSTDDSTVNYRETLTTRYFGAYVGARTDIMLGEGFSLGLEGDVGLYHARTNYQGSIDANSLPVGGPIGYPQPLKLNEGHLALITTAKVELKKSFGFAELALFGQGEYYSHAPKMNYNAKDEFFNVINIGGGPSTNIGSDDAWSATAGVKLTIPLN